MKRIIFSLIISLALLSTCALKVEAAVLFEDDFNSYSEGAFPSRWIEENLGDTPCPGIEWRVDAGRLRSIINSGGCVNNLVPNSSEWPSDGVSDYILDVDMIFVSGVDHNLGYRMVDNLLYEVHFIVPGTDFSFSHPDGAVLNSVALPYIFNKNYHLKAKVEDKNIKIYIDGVLVREVESNNVIPAGKIALRIGSGGGGSTETSFDNVRVTTLDHVDQEPEIGLSVPLIKQTDPAWGNDIYDSADVWAPGSPGLSRWGCALTSAVMVFHYNGLKKMADGTDITPGTANQWLKSQPDGYVGNGLLNWLALSRLSKQVRMINGVTFDALEYERRDPDNAYLSDSVENKSIPAILAVPGHFIVAKGVDSANSTFVVNDPFYDIAKLSDPFYGNSYQRMGIYTPSNTDLSYIMIVTNPHVNIELTNSFGDVVGEEEIENPIDDAVGNVINPKGPLKIFYLKKPGSGPYELNISSSTPGPYQLDQYFYDLNGQVKKISAAGTITAGKVDTYNISFDKNNAANNKSIKLNQVSYTSVKAKIIEGYKAKKIKDVITYLALLTELELSRKANSKVVKKAILDIMITTISKDKRIDKIFGQELIVEIKVLKSTI